MVAGDTPDAARLLGRLDSISGHLASQSDVVAVLGVGSVGVEIDRLDEHSDLDFFVVVDDGATQRYVADIDWLESAHEVVYSFANERNGRKALFGDGIFVEYAVFTVADLEQLPFTGARVVWARDDAPSDLVARGRAPAGPSLDTVEFHLGEALTNLYVGLHRELRGERLSASRFIQSYAVDRAVSLLRLTQPDAHRRCDPFDPTRRVESAYTAAELPLAEMVTGYDANPDAAATMLAWLGERFDVESAIGDAIRELIEASRVQSGNGGRGTGRIRS